MKRFIWAIVSTLSSVGHLLILLVSIFPFWVRLEHKESQEVFFSGLFENCFHVKCWKHRPLSIHIILGRVFLLSAVILSFLTTFIMVSFVSQLFPRTQRNNFVSAYVRFLTGTCAFLTLMHALESQELRTKPEAPELFMQWPYYVLGFSILLFIVVGVFCLFQGIACLRCHSLPMSQSIKGAQRTLQLKNLDNLGGELSSVQKESLLQN